MMCRLLSVGTLNCGVLRERIDAERTADDSATPSYTGGAGLARALPSWIIDRQANKAMTMDKTGCAAADGDQVTAS
jgi:hypothetical protein